MKMRYFPFTKFEILNRKNYRKFLKMKENLLNNVENTDVKGGITLNDKFLLLSQLFQKSSAAEVSEKESLCGKGLFKRSTVEELKSYDYNFHVKTDLHCKQNITLAKQNCDLIPHGNA